MEQNLQKFNSNQMHGIPLSTYYNQQRKVFSASRTAAESEPKPQFTEIHLPKESRKPRLNSDK